MCSSQATRNFTSNSMGYAGLFIAVYSKESILPVRFELGTPIIVHRVDSLIDEKKLRFYKL